jgi:hypothetical protein
METGVKKVIKTIELLVGRLRVLAALPLSTRVRVYMPRSGGLPTPQSFDD